MSTIAAPPKSKSTSLVLILASTLFASAFLLFWCEPMVGKMVLPLAGGTAAVWTTCLLFFQIMLLAGYLYAHVVARLRNIRHQFLIHTLVLALPFAFLPIRFGVGLDDRIPENPAMWLLGRLFVGAGLPFFALATTAPLLQNWFSTTTEDSAADPYFLYAASNAGSLSALLTHPFILEPFFGASRQSRYWFVGYFVLTLMVLMGMKRIHRSWHGEVKRPEFDRYNQKPTTKTRIYWVTAALLPSGLMLAVTNHIATNMTSAPFLWVIPLAVYLVTFVLAFARSGGVSSAQVSRVMPLVLLVVFIAPTIAGAVGSWNSWFMLVVHVGLLFCCALLCHTGLAEHRPAGEHLTEFYLWIAVGGVLGGVFTAIVAPSIFRTIFEYPLLVVMTLFLRKRSRASNVGGRDAWKWALPACIGVIAGVAFIVLRWLELSLQDRALITAIVMLTLAVYQLRTYPRVFATICALGILANSIVPKYFNRDPHLYVGRNFFGAKAVLEDPEHNLRTFVHGNTLHGVEKRTTELLARPLAYFHPSGPVGDVMTVLDQKQRQQVGILGLGAGSMAAYGGPARPITFFEIDPDVESVARRFFTFLDHCGTNCRVIIGDGRLELERVSDGAFDLLMMDAFSSDAVPAHLVSREALELYLSKLAPRGILLFNSTNRFLDIGRLVSELVTDAGLVAFERRDSTGNLLVDGKLPSIFVVAARDIEDLGSLPERPGWRRVTRSASFRVWTDDYSSLLPILRRE